MKWKYKEMYAPAPKQKNDDAYSGKLTTFYAGKKGAKPKKAVRVPVVSIIWLT